MRSVSRTDFVNGQVGLRWLKSTNPDIAEIKASLEDMVAQADRASEILANIRAMFRGDPHESTSLNVNDVVCDVLALVHGEIEGHGIAVHRHLQEDLPNIVGERVPLQQTVMNLILNAIDAMSVLPACVLAVDHYLEARQADGVLITAGDTGVGINAKDLDRILQPFFTTKPLGMGMGLPICQSIVAAHRGRLWATPVTPNGSTFHVYLPVLRPRRQPWARSDFNRRRRRSVPQGDGQAHQVAWPCRCVVRVCGGISDLGPDGRHRLFDFGRPDAGHERD